MLRSGAPFHERRSATMKLPTLSGLTLVFARTGSNVGAKLNGLSHRSCGAKPYLSQSLDDRRSQRNGRPRTPTPTQGHTGPTHTGRGRRERGGERRKGEHDNKKETRTPSGKVADGSHPPSNRS